VKECDFGEWEGLGREREKGLSFNKKRGSEGGKKIISIRIGVKIIQT